MNNERIRPIAICVLRRSQDDHILVFEGYDTIKDQTFYRPLGGAIEFGEHSRQAVVRELREEIGAEVTDLHYLTTMESIFVHNGQTGHELVVVYEGWLTDPALYECEVLDGVEDNGMMFRAVWVSMGAFSLNTPLYPTGLLDLLQQAQ